MYKQLASVIITTRNSASTMEPLLQSIKDQSYKNLEIIVVDNKSSDDTVRISKKFTKSVYQYGPERSSQRNFGVNKSKGKYILILDSDMVLTKDVVREGVALIENDSKIGGLVIPEKSFGIGFWAKMKILEREINEGERYFEAARFFPKRIFLEQKGYDTTLTGPEDWDLPERIAKKYKIGRIKSYILHNEGNLSLKTLSQKKYYYGLSSYKYLSKQKIPVLSSKTVYFLRPAFYRNWKRLLSNPINFFGLMIMLFVEGISGATGYLRGRFSE